MKRSDRVRISVSKDGFGTFLIGDKDISNSVVAVEITCSAGQITRVAFTLVPEHVEVDAEKADLEYATVR